MLSQDEIKDLVAQIVANANKLGLIWRIGTGTVLGGLGSSVLVSMDGDNASISSIPVTTMIGVPAVGTRVFVISVPPNGNYLIGTAGPLVGSAIARASRGSSSTAASGSQGVLRLDDVPLKAGRIYEITTSTVIVTSSVAGDRVTARLTATLDGTTATTGSALYAIYNSAAIGAAGDGESGVVSFFHAPTTDETLSVLLMTARLSGTGNARLIVGGNTSIDIAVIDHGQDPGDTGIDI